VITNTVRQDHIACRVLNQIFKVNVQGDTSFAKLRSSCRNKEKLVIRVTLAIQQYLLLGDDVSLLSVLLYGEVQDLIAQSHRIGKMTDLLSNNKDLEILSSINSSGKA
jgi:hypothetical protein